jgi:uncharacterized protein
MHLSTLFKFNTVPQPSGLYVTESIVHGRGVFCRHDLEAEELVEKAPLILINQQDKESLQQTILYHYYFVVSNPDTPVAIGLGCSSMYNHAYPANASYEIDLRRKLIIIKTTRVIIAGEEITINYNGTPDDSSPVSFPSLPI